MVDALLEARRVLVADGIVIDVRPITAPALIESVSAAQVTAAVEMNTYGATEDEAAADAAVPSILYLTAGLPSSGVARLILKSITIPLRI